MKTLKIILVIIAVIIAIPLITALFITKDYAVVREVVINKPVAEVFDYVKYLKNQDNYSKWNLADPSMKKSYQGEDGTVGFVSAWESNDENIGAGEQKIISITDGQRIDTKLHFIKPFEAEDDAYMITTAIDSVTTKVSWGFTGAFPYPMNLMKLVINMDKEVGNDLDEGLMNLKKILEQTN